MKLPTYCRKRSDSKTGFALVITLIMVALVAVIVVGLLINSSLERITATSYNHRYQAEVAAQNGLEAAKKALIASPTAVNSATAEDTFLVLRADGTQTNASGIKDAYYFLAKAQPGAANKVDCYPLFSGGTTSQATINLTNNPAVQKPQAPTAAFAPNPAEEKTGSTTKQYPQLLPFQQAAFTQWQEISDPNDAATAPAHNLPYQRFTFWVEDLAGYLDAGVVGNQNAGGSHQRANGTNLNEIALFTIFDPALQSDSGSTPAKDLISNRGLIFTVPTMKLIAPSPSGGKDLTQPNLAVRFGTDVGGEQNLIPFGYAYPNEKSPKTDLNNSIKSADVPGIATAINTALPNFKNRAGGNTFDYSKNLAANFIDYAASQNAPTTDGSTYRGIGAFPFFMSDYDLNNWINTIPPAAGGNYQVQIKVTTYIQLWNPHNIAVSGSLTLHYNNVDELTVNGQSVNYSPPPDFSSNVSMQPNEYKVFSFPPKTYTFDWGPTPPASNASIPFPGTTANFVLVNWNNKLADRQKSNLQRSNATVGMRYNPGEGATNSVWRGNTAPPIFPNLGEAGDPRISYYSTKSWTVAAYSTNSSWGGRPILTAASIQMQPSIWPDGGHDSTLGSKPKGDSEKPDAAAARTTTTPADADKWISRLSTKGSLDTLGELGNVFDPAQWKFQIPTTNSAGLPDIPSSATADSTAGGGFSLCIGRPEFSKFDSNGQRAWQLLDIFSLGTRFNTTGVVNINTASFEALRALAAGILQDRDKAILPAALATSFYPPTAKTPTTSEDQSHSAGAQADLFAQAVIDSRPLLSTAQLQTIKNSIGPFFANPKQSTDQTPPTEWNDSGREELFSKMLNLTSVRSRNFRVFVTGQSLDKTGKVLSTVNKVYQVFLQPHRNTADGSIQSQQIEIRYEATLL